MSPIIASMTPLDVTKPNIARMYDYWLGGKDNFEADREAAEAIRQRRPNIAEQALDNKRFQTRAITYVAGQGVRQFLDVGSGLPTSRSGRKARHPCGWPRTRRPGPSSRTRWWVTSTTTRWRWPIRRRCWPRAAAQVVAVAGDMGDPEAILSHPGIHQAGLRLDIPACVILCCVLHFLDAETARGVVARFARALAPGSYLIISIGWAQGQDGHDFASTYNAQDGSRIYAHSRDDITAMFDGTDLVPPGIVDCATWRADPVPAGRAGQTSMILGAVARRP